MECSICRKPTNLNCSRCRVKYYCSLLCQKQDYTNHKLDCSPRSADILVRNVFANELPTKPEVLFEYGFSNCMHLEDRTNLLGLYIGLIKIIGCSASQLHSWWESGKLSLHIKKTYDDGGFDSEYYKWFLKNEYVLQNLHRYSGENPDARMVDKYSAMAKRYLSEHDQEVPIKSLPDSKRKVFVLYMTILMGYIPRIEEPNWIDFGFCACKSSSGERQLGDLYLELIQKGCMINEFHDAYVSKSIVDLLKEKCSNCSWLSESRIEIRGYRQPIHSVYHLKQYVLSKSVDLELSVTVDYGFTNCRTESERRQLENMYRKLIETPQFDPQDLHGACIAGKIFDYVNSILPNEVLNADLLRNPYPLRDV